VEEEEGEEVVEVEVEVEEEEEEEETKRNRDARNCSRDVYIASTCGSAREEEGSKRDREEGAREKGNKDGSPFFP